MARGNAGLLLVSTWDVVVEVVTPAITARSRVRDDSIALSVMLGTGPFASAWLGRRACPEPRRVPPTSRKIGPGYAESLGAAGPPQTRPASPGWGTRRSIAHRHIRWSVRRRQHCCGGRHSRQTGPIHLTPRALDRMRMRCSSGWATPPHVRLTTARSCDISHLLRAPEGGDRNWDRSYTGIPSKQGAVIDGSH